MSREGASTATSHGLINQQRVRLQDVVTTAELRRRPSRPPDYAAENRALVGVMQAMTEAAEVVLQAIAEAALDLCAAHSAGVSLLEEHDGKSVFRWRAIAGEWSRFRDGTMPREASPCGTVLDQDDTLLVSRPERHFPLPAEAQPSIVEALLVPFRVAGVPVGTVWVISHDHERRFDAEDERLATSLGRFASNAYQVLALRESEGAASAGRTVAEDALRESEANFRSFFANAGVGMAQADIDTGRLVRVNQRFCEMTGYSENELLGMSFLDVTHAEDREANWAGYQNAMCGASSHYEVDKRYIRKDGRVIWVRINTGVVYDTAGRPARCSAVVEDITERKRNEMARRESEERLLLAAEAAGFGTYDANLQTGDVVWSEEMFRLLGFEPQGVMPLKADQALDFVHPDDRPSLDKAIQQSFDPDGDGRLDHAHRLLLHDDEGNVRWLRVVGDTAFAEVDGRRTAVRAVGAVIDITATKRHEEQIKMIVQELNHRVKNMLAVVQSVAQQTVRQAPDLETFADTFNKRLRSIGVAHSLLTQSNWERVGLLDIINAESRSGAALPEQCSVSGPPVMLPPKAALAVHMVIHELMTNARKYGGLTTDDGRLDITWSVSEAGDGKTVEMEWTEYPRHIVSEPSAAGYGSRLIAQLIEYELKGVLEREFRPAGMHCRISFPLSGAGRIG